MKYSLLLLFIPTLLLAQEFTFRQEFDTIPVEFDGKGDSMLPSRNLDGEPHIEYVQDLGFYNDLPFDKVITANVQAYGSEFFGQLCETREAQGQNASIDSVRI